MGLDAFVPCTCWEEGKTSEPPLSRDMITWEDGILELTLPYEGNQDAHRMFHEWKRDACSHPHLEYASERIANWWGYRAFQYVLAQIGWEHFPTLERTLPEANGGTVSPEDAAAFLAELRRFRALAPTATDVVLLNSDTGEHIRRFSPAMGSAFAMWGDYRVGFDAEGLFIRKGSMPLFRSLRLEIRPLADGEVNYIDLASGQAFQSRFTPHAFGMEALEGPLRLHVEERWTSAEEYDYILEPLERVMRASIEVGRPVYWC